MFYLSLISIPQLFISHLKMLLKLAIMKYILPEMLVYLVAFVIVKTEEINAEFIRISCTDIEVDPIKPSIDCSTNMSTITVSEYVMSWWMMSSV